ncbi:MAG: NusG domain II-containing protein [Oscillospiraceae bacterium]|nr:NusG domain II-containing protein [Oscillospiraceae bacterium]MDD4413586.1 NusG domain II-containing protein [Oscillospiraceae bacterium]
MKLFKKSDIIIVAAIIAVSLVFWGAYRLYFSETPTAAEIYYDSKLVMTVDLDKNIDKEFSIPQDKEVVFRLFSDGSIRFEKSDCRDKICIRSGKLDTVGQNAACLPNKTVLKIVRKHKPKKDDIDIIIGN